MLQPDTTKKTAAEEAEKDREADQAEKEAALERMRVALYQKQEAINAYHEALQEYQELLKEKQMKEWEKSWQWAFSADSLDSAGVFVWPALPEMPELFYFYDEEFEDIPMPEEPLFGCPDPRRLEYSYQFRYPDKRGIHKGDKPRIIIKDLDEDLLDDLDIDIYRHPDRDAYHPGKRYEKEIIVTPPDVVIPRAPRDPQIMIMKGNSPEKIMRQELIEDGLVRMGKDYIIELDSGSMYINGVKQSREVFKKYKKIYEGLIGETLEGDFSYKLVF